MPGRRDVRRLCEILMGGDRIGQVGYDALPPLARDVHDRLGAAEPEAGAARRAAGAARHRRRSRNWRRAPTCCGCCATCCRRAPHGRSWASGGSASGRSRSRWDLALGTHQRALIELGYEGVSIEQVLEQRLRRAAYGRAGDRGDRPRGGRGRDAVPAQPPPRRRARQPRPRGARRPSAASTARPRCCAGSGGCWRTTATTRAGAAAVDRVLRQGRLRALLHAAADGLHRRRRRRPPGGGDARLPVQHGEPGAVARLRPHPAGAGGRAVAPGGRRPRRRCCGPPGSSSGSCPAPSCARGATSCWPTPWWCPPTRATSAASCTRWSPSRPCADFVVEAVSNAFGRLPDPVLLPWLPTLITTLRSGGAELAPLLIREAGRIFPGRLAGPGRVGAAVAGPAGAGSRGCGTGRRSGPRAARRLSRDVATRWGGAAAREPACRPSAAGVTALPAAYAGTGWHTGYERRYPGAHRAPAGVTPETDGTRQSRQCQT